jgi:hypothetical protein
LVLLPHTIAGHIEFLESLPNHVYIFCRDHTSLSYVKSVHPFPQNVQFGRDMAFFYPFSRWVSMSSNGEPTRSIATYLFSFRCAEVDLRVSDLCEKSCELGINRDLLEDYHIGNF